MISNQIASLIYINFNALFVYVGLYPELFQLIKVYINYRSNSASNCSDPPIRHKRKGLISWNDSGCNPTQTKKV
jgi:hypothetical protein